MTGEAKNILLQLENSHFTSDDYLEIANAAVDKTDGFIIKCSGCGKLVSEFEEVEAAKRGSEQCCLECIRHCPACDQEYAPSAAYMHEDCLKEKEEVMFCSECQEDYVEDNAWRHENCQLSETGYCVKCKEFYKDDRAWYHADCVGRE